MQAFCSSSASASDFSFAARARIAVAYSDTSLRMSVVRLDRHGLIASVADDAGLPPLWLPRPARVLAGDDTLCELRLVARALTRPDGHTLELTMQPSRTNDNLSFWQALRARRHLYPDMPGGSNFIGRLPDELPPVAKLRQPEAASKVPNRSQTRVLGHPHATWEPEYMDADVGCEVLFKLLDNNDALFFSEWIEYHFVEIAAHAQAVACLADLHDIERRRTGTLIKVTFSYRWDSQAVQRATDEVCKRVVQEMERLFGLSLRYELLDVREDKLPPEGRLRPASSTSQSRSHSFSSK